MKRRRFFQTVAAAPAATSLLAQGPVAQPTGTPFRAGSPVDASKLPLTVADEAADMVSRFFTAPQLTALRRLSGILQPSLNGVPGAVEAQAAEFLDFLVGDSPDDRKSLYKVGLDSLNAQARKRFGKAFADIDDAQAAGLLGSLKEPWTYDAPADPLARFLRSAKADIRTATLNSREFNLTGGPSGGRRFGGSGQYWLPLD
jgi:hypothetical protein